MAIYMVYSMRAWNEAPFSSLRRLVYLRAAHGKKEIYQLYFRLRLHWPRIPLASKWETKWLFVCLSFEHRRCGPWTLLESSYLSLQNETLDMPAHEVQEGDRRARDIINRLGEIPEPFSEEVLRSSGVNLASPEKDSGLWFLPFICFAIF